MRSVTIEKVSYGLTTKNGDDYEKCHLEAIVTGDIHEAINTLKSVVIETLRVEIPMNASDTDRELTPLDTPVSSPNIVPLEPKKTSAKEEKENAGSRLSRKQKVIKELQEAGIEYNARLSADKLEALLTKGGENEEEEVKEVSVADKIKKAKYQTYDRTIDEHMDQLCDLLDEEWPSWEDSADLVKKEISKKLIGIEFLDDKGKVLPEFMEALDVRISFCIEKLGNS